MSTAASPDWPILLNEFNSFDQPGLAEFMALVKDMGPVFYGEEQWCIRLQTLQLGNPLVRTTDRNLE